MNKLCLLAPLAVFVFSTSACNKKDEDTTIDIDLTLKKVESEGGGLDQIPLQEWIPGQSNDGKTLTLDVTYKATVPQPGVSPLACLDVTDDEQIGERKCNGQTEAIRIKNVKIVCFAIGQAGRDPLETLAACPGSVAYHYASFNYPVKFSFE